VSAGQVALQAAIDSAKPQLESILLEAKNNFLTRFGDWVASDHRERLESLFMQAGAAKLASVTASAIGNEEEAREQQETYEAFVDGLETLGLALEITAKAEALAFLKAELHKVLAVVAAAAGAAVGALVTYAVPGIGFVLGPVAGAATREVFDLAFGTGATPLPTTVTAPS
jgi:hypothetical protein